MSRSQIWDGAAWVDLTGIPDLSVLDGRYLQLSGGQMAGNIDMQSGYTVFNLPNPANPGDATSKVWVESNFLALAGGQMTGPITSAGDIDLNPANELVVNIGGVDKFRVADTAAAFDVPLFVHATAQSYTGIGLYNESGGAANLRLEFAISATSQATRWQNTWSSVGYMQWIYGAAGATDSYITLNGPSGRIELEQEVRTRADINCYTDGQMSIRMQGFSGGDGFAITKLGEGTEFRLYSYMTLQNFIQYVATEGTYGMLRSPPVYNNGTGNAVNMSVDSSGRIMRNTSSIEHKANVLPLADSWDIVKRFEPISFTSLGIADDPNKVRMGFVWESMKDIDERLDSGLENYDLRGVVAHLTNVVQELMEASGARI